MPESDPDRLAEARKQIRAMKIAEHPVVRLADQEWPSLHEFKWRKWADMPESAKLSMLQDLVNWEGVSNRDMATILLIELDVGKLSPGQRDMLIRLAAPEQHGKVSLKDLKCRHRKEPARAVKRGGHER